MLKSSFSQNGVVKFKKYSSQMMCLSQNEILTVHLLLIMIIGETTFEHYSRYSTSEVIVRSP